MKPRAGTRRQIIINPAFQKYAKTIFMSLRDDQKKHLNIQEQQLLFDEESIDYFINRYPHEAIRLMLTKVGVHWIEIFGPDEKNIAQTLFHAYRQWDYPRKVVDVTDTMSRLNIYACSDRETMMAAYMIAQDAKSRVYDLSQETKDLTKRGSHLKKLKLLEVNTASDSWRMFNNLALETINSLDYAERVLGLSSTEVRIACSLFKEQRKACTFNDIVGYTKTMGKTNGIAKTINEMIERGLIVSDIVPEPGKSNKNIYYMLSSDGIRKVMDYIRFIHRATFDY